MDAYRKTIKRRRLLLAIFALAVAVIGIIDVFFLSEEMRIDYVWEFQFGVLIGLDAVALIRIFNYKKLLSDDELLRSQYNRENDERLKAIRGKAGQPVMWISSVIIIIAGIIAGYFNFTVFLTLVITGLSLLVFGCILKLVYMKIM